MGVIANSLPKSGTYVLVRLLELSGMSRSESALTGSLIRSTQRNPIKRFFVKRRKALGNEAGLQIDLEDLSNKVKTSWLKKYIARIPDNSFIPAHIPYSCELSNFLYKNGFKVIYIIRDPRDVLVSYINHQRRDASYPFHDYYINCSKNEAMLSVLVTMFSKRGQKRAGLRERITNSMGWIDDKNVCSIKFEELIGSAGGGSNELQRQSIKKILDHIDLNGDEQMINKISENVFYPKAKTFHKGQIGQWRRVCPPEIQETLNLFCGDLITKLGYEKYLER